MNKEGFEFMKKYYQILASALSAIFKFLFKKDI